MTSLRVLHWNANGLRRKVDILDELLVRKNIDVALISETHLGDNNATDFAGYDFYREDQYCTKKKCRGIAVFVKKDISHSPLPYQSLASMDELGIKVNIDRDRLRIFAGYRPPKDYFDVNDIRTLLKSSIPTIIAGDLNAKHTAWNSSTNCPVGNLLYEDAKRKGYVVKGPNQPTYYPPQYGRSPDVLDIMIHQGLHDRRITQRVLEDLESDHRPVLLYIPLS